MPTRKPAYAAAAHPMPHPMCTAPAIHMRRATPEEYNLLAAALRQSDLDGSAVRMDSHDTSFRRSSDRPDGISVDEWDAQQDSQAVDAVKSIATHYAEAPATPTADTWAIVELMGHVHGDDPEYDDADERVP